MNRTRRRLRRARPTGSLELVALVRVDEDDSFVGDHAVAHVNTETMSDSRISLPRVVTVFQQADEVLVAACSVARPTQAPRESMWCGAVAEGSADAGSAVPASWIGWRARARQPGWPGWAGPMR